jgi:benzoyl-CoA 2,3-dioxygenase component B
VRFQELLLPERYHEALVQWQRRNFPDLEVLLSHWHEHFPGEPPFSLTAKLAPLKDETIEAGTFRGLPKITRAAQMRGNMLYTAVRIVKAQCSTELGSIQQHLETLDSTVSDRTKFSILRICAEELRHAYQMFWVLSQDTSWSEAGVADIADQTMNELLAMTTGSHVLDAFNIPFQDPLDNMMFSFLIDRVGKYQLSMQQVFSYAPMAQSMAPMLHEESFHLRTGYELVRGVAVEAASGAGRWGLDEIQKRINWWFPRGAEMFGSPEGGQANVAFGFKDRLNGESFQAYTAEVARLLRRINMAVLQARDPSLSREAIERRAETEPGLLELPHMSFFRMRGSQEIALQPFGVKGNRLPHDEYWEHLQQVLPKSAFATGFLGKYRAAFTAAMN